MKFPIVKEWGSWAVFFSSVFAGLIPALLTKPWQTERYSAVETILTILGMTLLINSKNPLASALKAKEKREHVLWFLFFVLTGLALLIPFLIEGLKTFLIFALLIASYAILLSVGKEHQIVTELNGFALLTIAAPVVYFAITGEMSWKLYLTVTMFFAAGVFKVRVRIRKTPSYRVIMMLYCAAAFGVFHFLDISALLLLPLIENIATAVWIREEKLRTTGNIELTKAVIFVVLMGFFWR